MASLWAKLQGWLLMAGAVLLVLVGAYAAGGRAAKRSAAIDEAQREAKRERAARQAQESARETRYEVDAEVRGLGDGDAAERLRRDWSRDR